MCIHTHTHNKKSPVYTPSHVLSPILGRGANDRLADGGQATWSPNGLLLFVALYWTKMAISDDDPASTHMAPGHAYLEPLVARVMSSLDNQGRRCYLCSYFPTSPESQVDGRGHRAHCGHWIRDVQAGGRSMWTEVSSVFHS